ncbi:BLUF domain-containing protein [uncultured Hymenobacter sp.]|uniref:BLUF domain-containing protein n=1 Tax=uncultured Hymenobacter sp. TaxID=170016 RepID=UPI0035CC612B
MNRSKLTYVIEDDSITATLTRILLEKNLHGSRVQTYANGQQAIDQLTVALSTGTDDVPDLILLDLNMPLMDGWEFLEAFSRLPLPTPVCVLVLTSSINPEDRAKAARYQNVAGYFAKPLQASGVLQIMRLRCAAGGPELRELGTPEVSLHHLVYQSHATAPLDELELARLLTQSRAFNAAHGLTGILLYSHGNIIQLLEGTKANVREVFARIARDPRHTQVVKLADGPVTHRLFGQWSMGFQVVNPLDFNHLTGYVNPDQAHYLAHDPALPDPDLHTLLATFVSDNSRLMEANG